MFRSLPAAFALVAALLTIALRTPDGNSSLRLVTEPLAPAKAAAGPGVLTAGSEEGVSLAQQTWGIGRVTLPGSRRSPWDMAMRGLLTVIIFVCAAIAYGGLPAFSESLHLSSAQPRRLADAFVRSLHSDAAATKATHDAASRNVALLRVKGHAHRMARLDEGEDGVLDDDRDYARIRGYLARAEVYAQRQQYEKAADLFREATHQAQGCLKDLKKVHSASVEIEEASLQLGDAVARSASFFLERGQTMKAKKVLQRAAPFLEGRTDITSMRIPLLEANADRDAGKLDEAIVGYKKVELKIAGVAEQSSVPERAELDALAAEASGERARAMLSQGQTEEALRLLQETLRKLTVVQGPRVVSSSLVVRLNGWLGFAYLKKGDPARAVDSLDAALAGLGELPAGLAGATTVVQDILQTRAAAKAALGRVHSATEDLEVIRGLQDELLKTVNDGHNPDYAFGDGFVPDPRLWASLARTTTIAAELKLRNGHAKEAVPLARKALHLLREVKKTDGKVPKGCNLATFKDVKEMLAKAKSQRGAVAFLAAKSQEEKEEEESEASHDEMLEKAAESHDDKLNRMI